MSAAKKLPVKAEAAEEQAPPAKPKFDWGKPIEQVGIWLTRPMAGTGDFSICLGNFMPTQMGSQGIVKRILLLPSHMYLVMLGNKGDNKVTGAVIITGDGTYSVVDHNQYDLGEL